MRTITLHDSPTQSLDGGHLATLVAATLRATASALRNESVGLTQWLVYRPDNGGFRGGQTHGADQRRLPGRANPGSVLPRSCIMGRYHPNLEVAGSGRAH